MLIVKKDEWPQDSNEIEKFMAERIIQRCDYTESISNRHRTSCGYTQVKELINYCHLSEKRVKSIKTLIAIIEESRNNIIPNNIINDKIINSYFIDLKNYIHNFDLKSLYITSEPNIKNLQIFKHKLQVFENQLDKNYFSLLKREFENIKVSHKFNREAENLTSLIDLLIPYLIFWGFSVSSILEIVSRKNETKNIIQPATICEVFTIKETLFTFLIAININNKETKDFVSLLQREVIGLVSIISADDFNKTFNAENVLSDKKYKKMILFTSDAIDPNGFIRILYDKLIKGIVTQKDRQSLSPFNNFFDNCFWAMGSSLQSKFNKVNLNGDPIDVKKRGNTLQTTLAEMQKDYKFKYIPGDFIVIENKQLRNAVYYYNLALGSKSIENSLSLLWTSLEAIIPYRMGTSDIDCIQHFVSTTLSFGSFCRDIQGLVNRFTEVNNNNIECFESVLPSYSNKSNANTKSAELTLWYKWLIDSKNENHFDLVKNQSNLLAYEYCRISHSINNGDLKSLSNRIKRSKESIKYQLQRIYLHRNQIVHSGEVVSEYTNLWIHLEWYVGKILAYSLVRTELNQIDKTTIKNAFREIESDYEYCISYLNLNPKNQISKLPERIFKTLIEQTWQSF